MIVRIIVFTILLALNLDSIAQEEGDREACATSENKKAVKLFTEASDKSKKIKKDERMQMIREALDLDPEYVAANCEFGLQLERSLNYQKASKEPCIKYFEKVINACPEYHSAPYYIMAEIYFDKGDYKQAVDYYEKFLAFNSDYDEAYSRTYESDRTDAKDALGWAKFYAKHYDHEVPFNPMVVKGVSTKGNQEYLPLITPDNEHMYFTRRMEVIAKVIDGVVDRAEKPHIERFCVSEFDPVNGFDEGTWMTDPFNNDPTANYGGVTMSIDNKHLYMTVCKPKGTAADPNYVNCDIYSSDYVYENGEWYWTELQNMGPNINTDDGWESQPTLSADGKTLYFSTYRPKGTKGLDIFFSTKDENGNWTPARTVGDHINTEYNDKTPFVHCDSHTLYFSSEGHYGFGGFDVFYARANDDGEWGDPENMGYPINTEGNEHGFIVSTDGERVYFASNSMGEKGLGGYDIFSFELYKEARPDHVVFLKGNVKDEHNQPLKDAKIEMKNAATGDVKEFDVDENDGSYAAVVTVKEDQDIVMKVKAEGKVFNSQLFDANKILEEKKKAEEELMTADNPNAGGKLAEEEVAVKFTPMSDEEFDRSSPSKMNAKKVDELASSGNTVFAPVMRKEAVFKEIEITMEPIELNKPFQINDIHYTTNSSHLTKQSEFVLNEFIEFLNDNPTMTIAIHGHTDNQGDQKHNLTLSTDRAYSVMAYLQENGIDKERLSFKGYGETKPVAPNTSPEGRAKNRRTEFVILSR